jgi:hypothetical protein
MQNKKRGETYEELLELWKDIPFQLHRVKYRYEHRDAGSDDPTVLNDEMLLTKWEKDHPGEDVYGRKRNVDCGTF